MGILWPRSSSMEFDNNGDPAEGAQAYFYDAGTSTPKTVYTDGDESVAHEFPLEADGNGRWPAVYIPFGSYKVILKTSGGTTLSTIDDVPNPAPTDPAEGVDADQLLTTGDVIFQFKSGSRDGFVRCNGKTIGSATSGGTERANADCEDLFTYLWNNLSNTACPVSTGRGANAAADWAADKNIGLPDMRSILPVGLSDMGNSDNGALSTIPVSFGSATTPGSLLGAAVHVLATSELPSHLHAVSITTSATSGDHTHAISITSAAGSAHSHGLSAASAASGGAHTHTGTTASNGDHSHTYSLPDTAAAYAGGGSGARTTTASSTATSTNGAHTHTFTTDSGGAHTHTLSGSSDSESSHTHLVSGTSGGQSVGHTHNVVGNSGNTGSGGAHNNTPYVSPGTYYIKL